MKRYLIMFFICFLFGISNVLAKEVITQNGVKIDEDKYEKLVNIYSKSYIDTLTSSEYEYLDKQDLSEIQILEYVDVPISRDSSYSSPYKSLKIINANKRITILLTWKKDPKIRSYDVFGIRFSGLKLNSAINFKQTSYINGKINISSNGTSKKLSNGFGVSFLLSSGDSLESSLTFDVVGTGMIFATYQHATSNISLDDSTSYTISSSGLGSVLLFPDNIMSKYDGMPGVSISV